MDAMEAHQAEKDASALRARADSEEETTAHPLPPVQHHAQRDAEQNSHSVNVGIERSSDPSTAATVTRANASAPSTRSSTPTPPHAETSHDDGDGDDDESDDDLDHRWLDYIPLPYRFVAPGPLRQTAEQQFWKKQQKHKREMQHEMEQAEEEQRQMELRPESGHPTRPSKERQQAQGKSQMSHRATRRPSPPLAAEHRKVHHPRSTAYMLLPPRRAKLDFLRRLFGELIGTFLLVLTHAMLRLKAQKGQINEGGNALLTGLTLVFLIYSFGEVSGAHFNPSVTMAMTMRFMFPIQWMLPYWTVQLIGALAAGGVIQAFYGPDAHLGSSFVDESSRFTDVSAMLFESLLTFILVHTILSVTQLGHLIGEHAALAVGAAIAVDVGIGAEVTGGSMNPFRSLGPAIVNGPLDEVWPMVAGPFIGATIAAAVTAIMATHHHRYNVRKTAMGMGKQRPE